MDAAALADALAALANANRLETLRYLREPRYVEEVASHLGMARQAAAKHLAVLVEAGLVRTQAGRRGKVAVTEYVTQASHLFDLSERFAEFAGIRPTADLAMLDRTISAAEATGGGRARPTTGPELEIVHGRDVGRVVPIAPPFVIGRHADAGLRLDEDSQVSARHATIERGEGGLVLLDLRSTNGTHVAGRRVTPNERVPLRAGDVIVVGRTRLVYRT